MKRLAQIGLWSLAAIIIVLILVRLGLPFAVKQGVSSWFSKQDLQAQVADVSFDISDGTFLLTGLSATHPDSGANALQLSRLYLRWSWRDLSSNIATLDTIQVDGLSFSAERKDADTMVVAGIDLSQFSSKEQDQQDVSDAEQSRWQAQVKTIKLADTHICYKTFRDAVQNICVRIDALDWDGNINYDLAQTESDLPLKIEGDLVLSSLNIHNNHLKRDMLVMQSLQLQDIAISTVNNIGVAQLEAAHLRLLQTEQSAPAPEISRFDSLSAHSIKLNNLQSLSINKLAIKGHNLAIVKRKDGQFDYQQWLPADDKAESQPNKHEQDSKPFTFFIKQFDYTTDNSLRYVDNSLSQPFDVDINHIKLHASNIDNSKPDQTLKLSVKANYRRHGKIKLGGTAQPFAEKPSFDLNGDLAGIDLRSLSAYTLDALGHTIKSGQLDAKLKLLADKAKLDSKIDLTLHQFELKAQSKQDADKLDAMFGFPLNTSLSLLKDRDNTIRLTIPVTGELDKPDFDPQDAINKALSKAITAAVINYYTPYGLVLAADTLYSLATALRFDPVLFKPGSNQLADGESESIDKIASLMQDRPGVTLTLCGYANQSDRIVLLPDTADIEADKLKLSDEQKKRLLNLAEQRADTVKQALVDKQVDASRLVLCAPEYDETGELAGVEIRI